MESDKNKSLTQSGIPLGKGNYQDEEQMDVDNTNYVLESYKESTTIDNEQYKELGDRYKCLSEESKDSLIKKIIDSMKTIDGPKREYLVNIQLCHWFRTDINLGITIAKGLDLDLSETLKQMPVM